MEFFDCTNTKLKKERAALALVSIAILANACTTIHENNAINKCNPQLQTPIVATFNPNLPDYHEATDPVILAQHQKTQAEVKYQADSHDWSTLYSNQVIGVGEMVCSATVDNHKIYFLTTEGAQISLAIRFGK